MKYLIVSIIALVVVHFGDAKLPYQIKNGLKGNYFGSQVQDASCDSSKWAACDALCMLHLPYSTGAPLRSGCLDEDNYCWCCDPSTDNSGAVITCPDPSVTNCDYGCHRYEATDTSNCPSYPGTYYPNGPSY